MSVYPLLEAPPRTSRPPRDALLLIVGQSASTVGDGCYAVALPWYLLGEGHGGDSGLGLVLGAYGIARAAAMPIGGALCDRIGPRRVLFAVDVIRAVLLGGLALAVAGAAPSLLIMAVASALIGACHGAFAPGSFALMPSVSAPEDLQRANAGLTGAQQAGSLIGPGLGAALLATGGPTGTFALDAVTFAISAFTLAMLRSKAVDRSKVWEPPPKLRGVVTEQPALPVMLVVVLAGNIASGGIFAVAMPVLARDRYGVSGLGLVLASLAGGAVVGTLLGSGVRARQPAVLASLMFLVQAAALASLPSAGGLVGAALAAVVFGASNAFGELIMVTAMQRTFPAAVLGRIMGLVMLASTGAFPISVALITAVVAKAGAAAAFPLAGACGAIVILLSLSSRSFRRFATGAF